MTGIFDILLGLLLLPFIKTGINGEDNLILAGRGYTISSPCNGPLDLICYVIWQFSTTENSAYVAIVSNGVIQAAKSKAKGRRPRSKCAMSLRNLTTEDVGHFRCHKRQSIFSPLNTAVSTTESNVMPGQTVTLHCALLTNRRRRFCVTQQGRQIRLKWVDEAGDDVLEDSQHQIWPLSPCDVTLTVALQRDDRRKFKCQASVDEEFTVSEEIPLRVPGRKGRGRGMMIELDTEDNEGGQQDVTVVAVAVAGCVVLAAAVALFVLNRKRANRQLSDVPGDTTSADDDGSADDVTYADINLPTGSEAVRDTEYQATVYASIRTAA